MPEEAWQQKEITLPSWPEDPIVSQEKPKMLVYWREDPFTQSDLISTMDEVQGLSSPSIQTDLLSTKDDQVQRLIHRIRKSKHESLANQLRTLFDLAKEEKPTSLGIALDSLINFHGFLRLHAYRKTPTLSLTPDYNIYASWRAENRIFSAHFLPNGDIRFVILNQDRRNPKQRIRLTGTVTSDSLMEVVCRESLDWVFV